MIYFCSWEMEQKHIEQLRALEEKRRQIEELEEAYHRSEEVRLAQQQDQEAELEGKRCLLEKMQQEAEEVSE